MNIAVVMGTVGDEPYVRDVDDHEVRVSFDLTTSTEAGNLRVPVSWTGPPKSAPDLTVGEEVLVHGVVRKHFFSNGGRSVVRMDLLADPTFGGAVVQGGIVKRTNAARRRLERTLSDLA